MRYDLMLLLVTLPLWGVEVGRRLVRSVPTSRGSRWWSASVAVAAGMCLWWWYLRANDPSFATPLDLMRPHSVDAGGGTIPTSRYLWFLTLATSMGGLFVFVGHFVCQRTRTLEIRQLMLRDIGLFYYIGMALFLMLQVAVGMLSGHAYHSAVAILLVFFAVSAFTIHAERVFQRSAVAIASNADVLALIFPVVVGVLCLLQYVVTRRGGPFYEDVARYIVTVHQMPLVNRHFGQSVLASTIGFAVGMGPDNVTFPRALLNNWLYVSQVALMFVLFRVLWTFQVSRRGCFYGVAILMLGNSALSLLPHILYDHDFPFVMNIYTDSLFGIAGWLIVVLFLVNRAGHAAGEETPWSWWPTLLVPAAVVLVFNYTSELNLPLLFSLLGALGALSVIGRRIAIQLPFSQVIAIAVVFAIAGWAGALQGGVFAQRFASESRKSASPLWELDASQAEMQISDPRWWYMPHIVLGFSTGFGNAPLPAEMKVLPSLSPEAEAAQATNESANQPLLQRFAADRPQGMARYSNLIYLFELRVGEMVRILWFPVAGLLLVGMAVFGRSAADWDQPRRHRLTYMWLIAVTSFALGIGGLVLTNSTRGNALFWKWALTRISEPGLCLAMVMLVIGVDVFLQRVTTSGWRHAAWIGLVALMSFGTLFRILAYPSFNG